MNGLFALSEIAIVSSKRASLPQMADEGKAGAGCALRLASEPTRFLCGQGSRRFPTDAVLRLLRVRQPGPPTVTWRKVLRAFETGSVLGDDGPHFHTLGGLVIQASAACQAGFRFEVVDMDGNRVDRVLVSRIETNGARGRQSS